MLIKKPSDIRSSEITPEGVYMNRRGFLSAAGGLAIAMGGTAALGAALSRGYKDGEMVPADGEVVGGSKQEDKPNTYEQITTYNNGKEAGDLSARRPAQAEQGRGPPLPAALR